MRPRRLALALLVAGSAVAGAQAGDGVEALRRGQDALVRHDIAAATAAFRVAVADRRPGVRAAGERELATIAWRLVGRPADAGRHFSRALATGIDSGLTLVERARHHIAAGRYADGARDAAAAISRIETPDDVARAARTVADAAVERWLRARVDSPARAGLPVIASADLATARVVLERRVREYPGRAADALALLHVRLLSGEGAADAWRSLYLLETIDGASGVASLGATIAGAFAAADSSGEVDVLPLLRALTASRLYTAAAIVATRPTTPAAVRRRPEVLEAMAYLRFTRALRRDIEAYYMHALARGAGTFDLQRVMTRHTRDLWPRLAWSGPMPPYTPAGATREIARRFGGIMSQGEAVGVRDLHFAHVVGAQRREVLLGSRRVAVTHVVVDGSVSNGLQSWLSDREGQRAGLASGDTIIQVRTSFTEYPFLLWQAESDPVQRAYERDRIAADSAMDLARARRDSITWLPGVAARLARDGRTELLGRLRAGDRGASQMAFVTAIAASLREGSIIAHEARHVLNAPLRLPRIEDEFRAKLSEVREAPLPRLALGAILHPNVGDATTHGQANQRVLLGIVRWIRRNGASIPGYDATLPALPQLPLLDDAQLRAAFASLDPVG